MASIGEVNAETQSREKANEILDRNKIIYFGVFFDGTGQDMVQGSLSKMFRKETQLVKRNDEKFSGGANQLHQKQDDAGYSNVDILHSVYQSMTEAELKQLRSNEDVTIYNIYVEGPGGIGQANGKGGSGVTAKVGKAMAMVRERLSLLTESCEKTELHFDVFGFSRGAAAARLFSYMVLKTSSSERLDCESEFISYLPKKMLQGDTVHFLDQMKFKDITVDFLGIFDTVSSIGGLSIASYQNTTTEYGLYSPNLDKVKSTCHLCAIDEFREHFALTDLGNAATSGDNLELFVPGCHSDVGGSYTDGTSSFALKPKRNIRTGQVSRYFPATAVNSSNSGYIAMTRDGLRTLGWVLNNNEYDYDFAMDKITVTREVRFGYSNLPLAFMHKRSASKTGRATFKEIPKTYEAGLPKYLADMMSYIGSSGRQWYYPGGSYSSREYSILRRRLHCSSSFRPDKYSSYDGTKILGGELICRIVYHGNKGNSTPDYMSNYS